MHNSNITVPGREVKVLAEADVVVVGAGVSGVCAALAAARNGARTVLVEKNAFPGGVATAALMMSACNFFITRSGESVSEGLPREIFDSLVAEGGAMPDYARPEQPQIPNDPEVYKRVMIAKLRAAGVTTLYGTLMTQVISGDGRVEAILCEAKGGAFALKARNFVDASGEMDLLAMAGAPHTVIRQKLSLLFRMGNVDIDAIVDWYEAHPENYDETADVPTSLRDTIRNWRQYGVFHLPHYPGRKMEIVEKAVASGKFVPDFGRHVIDMSKAMAMFASRANHGMVLINSMGMTADPYDIVAKSQCEEEGRLAAKHLADFLVKHYPGFKNSYIVDTATELGVRQLRVLSGKYTLTEEEFLAGKRFDDVVGRAITMNWAPPPDRGRSVVAGEIPFRCLVADAPVNVICGCGRSASTSAGHKWSFLRIQVPTMVIGQAAGTAAALATAQGVPVTAVDIPLLQKTLKAQGVSFHPEN